jgi:hypothetical protein
MSSPKGKEVLPERVQTFVAQIVQSIRYHPDVAQHVHAELIAHFYDALEDEHDEARRDVQAITLIETFGDSGMIGFLIREVKRKCLGGGGINYSSLGGTVALILLLLTAVALGGVWPIFVNLPALVVSAGCVIGLTIMAVGFREFCSTLYSLRNMCVVVPPQEIRLTCPNSLRTMIANTYAALGIVASVGTIYCLAHWHAPHRMGSGMAVAFLGVLYCLFSAEGILGPTLRRLETLIAHNTHDARENLANENKTTGGPAH